MRPRRTYWHLEGLRRVPSDYDVATTALLYYPPRGFEVRTPVVEWYEKHQRSAGFWCDDWDAFRDPRETTYAKYVESRKSREIFVDGLLEGAERTGYDARLGAEWIPLLGRFVAPLVYPLHGLQMVSCYVGQLAPGGRIVVACLLQAADEIRRIQRIAMRTRQLQAVRPDFGEDARTLWESDPVWQPLREVVERLLVTYDFVEAWVALNLVVKPVVDEIFLADFARRAERAGDDLTARVLGSFREDASWQREWSSVLGRTWRAASPENADVIRAHLERWRPRALAAAAPFATVLEMSPSEIEASCRTAWEDAGADGPRPIEHAG